jgi:hypothetical protein
MYDNIDSKQKNHSIFILLSFLCLQIRNNDLPKNVPVFHVGHLLLLGQLNYRNRDVGFIESMWAKKKQIENSCR